MAIRPSRVVKITVYISLLIFILSIPLGKKYFITKPRRLMKMPLSSSLSATITKQRSPPVIVKPTGGIGNQLFQYACGYTVARRRNSDLYLLLPPPSVSGRQRTFDSLERKYALDQFSIPQNKLIFLHQYNSKNYTRIYIQEQDILKGNLPEDKVLQLNDYCDSEIFFKPYKKEIVKLFQLKNISREGPLQDLLATVTSGERESVAVHIRRGDFSKFLDYRVLPISYYKRAMKFMSQQISAKIQKQKNPNIIFFIFSDDIEYAKLQLSALENVIFVSGQNQSTSINDFLIMINCKHIITSNSTYSWWAAYLNKNPNKIVIVPFPKYRHPWFNNLFWNKELKQHKQNMYNFSYPSEWLKFNPFPS